MAHIIKIGLVDVDEEGLLVVRKKDDPTWILPGGKPEGGEDAEATLRREVRDEIGCEITDLVPLTVIHSQAADRPGDTVEVHCIAGRIVGDPRCAAEIVEARRIPIDGSDVDVPLAPSIVQGLLPILNERSRRYYVVYDQKTLGDDEKARIDFGIEEDPERGFAGSEMSFVWESVGRFEAMRVCAYDDAIGALSRMGDVLAHVGSAHAGKQKKRHLRETLTTTEVVAILGRLGFADMSSPPAPNEGTILFTVTRTHDGMVLHHSSAAWKALEWCRSAVLPFGSMLSVTESAVDADAMLDGSKRPIRTFEYHDEGTPPIERDIHGNIVPRSGT